MNASDTNQLLQEAVSLSQLGQHEAALAGLERLLALDPANVDALNNRASMLVHLQRYKEAVSSYDAALRVKPDFAPALGNRGIALARIGRFRDAVASFDLALAFMPEDVELLRHRGDVLARMGNLQGALANYESAIAIRPDVVELRLGRGFLLARLNRFGDALENCDQLLKLAPDYRPAHVHEGLIRLLLGDLQTGLRKYEWRRLNGTDDAARRSQNVPFWTGRAKLQGKTIVLYGEQGLGSLVQFARFVPMVAEKGASVILEVPVDAAPLIAGLKGISHAFVRGAPWPAADFRCPLPSLPLAMGTTMESIPAPIPYLSANREAAARWQSALSRSGELLVGVCWRGDARYPGDHERSIPFAEFAPLLTLPGVRFVSLQKDLTEDERQVLDMIGVAHPGANIENTAALTAALDLVISVDTLWAHWAGATDVPLWVLLAYFPHWTWFLNRAESPWYPRARLFRQPGVGDWRPMLRRVRNELADLAAARSRTGMSRTIETTVRPASSGEDGIAALLAAGHLDQAELESRQMIRLAPSGELGWKLLGASLAAKGRPRDSLMSFGVALELAPSDASVYKNLSRVLQAEGRVDEAEEVCRQLVDLVPEDFVAQCNLGHMLLGRAKWSEAEACYRRAVKLKPGDSTALNYLGIMLCEQGRHEEAEAVFRQALKFNPMDADVWNNLGNALHELRQLAGAESSYREALRLKQDYHLAHCGLGSALRDLGRLDDAESSFRAAIALKSDFAAAYVNLGDMLRVQGRKADAEVYLRRAVELQPDLYLAYNALGVLCREIGRASEAIAYCRRALGLRPGLLSAYNNIGNAMADLGQLSNAEACYRRALEINPKYSLVQSNLLFLLAYFGAGTVESYLEEAKSWEEKALSAQSRAEASAKVFAGTAARTGRRLKVGYLSGDFRMHPVSYFMEKLLENHDRNRVEVFAYSTNHIRDAMTEKIQRNVEHWCVLEGISDDDAVERISRDGIDVLVDLSGHTSHHRLEIMARRAAPVQCDYLGYFASTGLSQIDYCIADATLVPERFDNQYSEQIWRLPRVWVSYAPSANAPTPAWLPRADGKVCLGSFNHLGKITERTLDLWAKVLLRLPDTFLLLKTRELEDSGNRSRILAAFEQRGCSATRIELQGRTPDWTSHMALYDRVDIALDPVGAIGGSTTTCDALWMGVPVVTLCGGRQAERMTASMLDAIGHPEWSASSDEEYVNAVARLKANPALRKEVRLSLRETMNKSPLCDSVGLARALEDAFESMFDLWHARRSQKKESKPAGE